MSRAALVKNYNNFANGVVTEANALTPPENAVKAALNCEITKFGINRRLGLDKEDGAISNGIALNTTSSPINTYAADTFDWESPNKNVALTAVVRQTGGQLDFYHKGENSSLVDSYVDTVGLSQPFPISGTFDPTAIIQCMDIEGVLFAVNASMKPITIFHPNATTYEAVSYVNLIYGGKVRDFAGVDDGLEIDENPLGKQFVFSSVTGTFTVGEVIAVVNGSTTRRWRVLKNVTGDTWVVDKALSGLNNNFDGTFAQPTGGTVTGETSGATATLATVSGTGLSDTHRYNLLNQGWPQEYMDTYVSATASGFKWPNNTQIWYQGRDSDNNFSVTELLKISFGNSAAPKGHITLYPHGKFRSLVIGCHTLDDTISSFSFVSCAANASRAAFVDPDGTVYISRIVNPISDPLNLSEIVVMINEATAFYQSNDPTAEIGNELLPDDGVVIPIKGVKNAQKIIAYGNGWLMLAENGVWYIGGLGLDQPFTADAYTQTQVSTVGVKTPASVVVAAGTPYFWGDDGIYTIVANQSGLKLEATNITNSKIKTLYDSIPLQGKLYAKGYYDKARSTITWAYCDDPDLASGYMRGALLTLDLALGAYYPYKLAVLDTTKASFMAVSGFTQDTNYPGEEGLPALKLMMTLYIQDTFDAYATIMEFNNPSFYDYGDFAESYVTEASSPFDDELADELHNYSSYFTIWDDPLGDPLRKKEAQYVFCYFYRTEDGFEEDGIDLVPTRQSGVLMNGIWSWADSEAGGKMTTPRQVYRYSRVYIPDDVSDTYDTGNSLIITKNKVRGTGYALGLHFAVEDGKDMQMKGVAIPYTSTVVP